MGKPWHPSVVRGGKPPKRGWVGQWDRHRWPMSGQKRRRPDKRGGLGTIAIIASLFGLAVYNTPAMNPPSGPERPAPGDSMRVERPDRVIDGDTFVALGERIRIADIDTPEVEGRCPAETALAARATTRMRALLNAGPFELHPLASGRDEDRYGRKLRIVTRAGRSLGDQMVAEGLARTWSGRREPWC